MSWRCGRKRISSSSRASLSATAGSASVRSRCRRRIDYAIALLKHNGDTRAELHRESFETCPECKRQKCLVPSIVLN